MNRRQRGHLFGRQSTPIVLIVAFLAIKTVLSFSFQEYLSHLLISLILLMLPGISGELKLWSRLQQAVLSVWTWTDAICMSFFMFPLILNFLLFAHQWQETSQAWNQWLLSQSGMCSVLIAPVAEEIFFRGWFLDRQRSYYSSGDNVSHMGIVKICYLNALVFWSMHLPLDVWVWKEALLKAQIPASPGPFLLGFVCCFLTLRAGHIRSAIVFHAIANGAGPLWWPLLRHESVRSLFYQY